MGAAGPVTAPPPEQTPLRMRDAGLRLNDFYEVYEQPGPRAATREAARCMNCGAAFCTPRGGYRANDGTAAGCPTHNTIPGWNRLVHTGRWRDAYERLALTNNFPEFTARVCPAPCQDACIVGINDRPVSIKAIERTIIDRAFEEGWVRPRTPASRTGACIAVVGSGPAGLAAADELNAAGHTVTVYERSDHPGGLLTDGIPSMKLDPDVVRRRIGLLLAAGVRFEVGRDVGGIVDPQSLCAGHDAVILATGALAARDLDLPGRGLAGVTQALPYLKAAARERAPTRTRIGPQQRSGTGMIRGTVSGVLPGGIDAAGKHVVIIGGGDTGADCIATALRQRAASVTNITRREKPPEHRDAAHPWPGPRGAYTLDYAHAEGVARHGRDPRAFAVRPLAFHAVPGTRRVGAVEVARVHTDRDTPDRGGAATEQIRADLVILSIGFTGHDSPRLFAPFSLTADDLRQINPRPGLYVAGDLRRGPSLVVHAIAEGRAVAARVQRGLRAGPVAG